MKLGLSSPLEHRSPEEWAENMKRISCQAVNFPVDCEAPGGPDLEKYRELIDRTDPDMPVIIEHLDSDQEYLESLGYIRNIFKI